MSQTDPGIPPPPPPSPPRRLTRRADGMIGGVASGTADYLGVDPAIARIAFVILAFVGGIGLLLYAAGWLLLPVGDPHAAAPTARVEASGAAFWVGVGLLTVAALVLVDRVWFLADGTGAALVFIALGIALWTVGRDRRATRPPSPGDDHPAAAPSAPSAPSSATSGTSPTQETVEMPTATDPAWTPPPTPAGGWAHRHQDGAPDRHGWGQDWTPPPVPPRERSVLGRVTLALAFLAVGGGYLLDQLGVIATFSLRDALATGLLVVGLGLVVGTWVGRARWLILVGLSLLPFVVASSLAQSIGLSLAGGFGERVHTVVEAGELQPRYEFGAGEFVLDLRDLRIPAGGARTEVSVGAGEVRVYVPDDVDVVVDADVRVGELRIGDEILAGTGLASAVELPPRTGSAAGAGVLHLDLRLAAGELRIIPTERSLDRTEESTP